MTAIGTKKNVSKREAALQHNHENQAAPVHHLPLSTGVRIFLKRNQKQKQ